MATAAVRTQKRELEPHWRDALRASLKRLALRTWGALLLGVSFHVVRLLAVSRAWQNIIRAAYPGTEEKVR